jgi:hypothetical protein
LEVIGFKFDGLVVGGGGNLRRGREIKVVKVVGSTSFGCL